MGVRFIKFTDKVGRERYVNVDAIIEAVWKSDEKR